MPVFFSGPSVASSAAPFAVREVSSVSCVGDSVSTATLPRACFTAEHHAVMNHHCGTELQPSTGKCKIGHGSQIDPRSVDSLAEQRLALSGTAVEHVDTGLAQSCTTEPLDQLVAGTTVLPNVGCGATDSGDDNITFDPPCVDWARILQAQEGPWLSGINTDYVEVSSVFSGIGTEHHVGHVLMSGCDRSVRGIDRILHSAAFEILPRAPAGLLRTLWTVPSLGTYATFCRQQLVSGPLRGLVHLELSRESFFDQQVQLATASFCHRSGQVLPVRLGDASFAGIPCVDYSPVGLRKQTHGPTGLLVLVWARMIQVHRPKFVVIE